MGRKMGSAVNKWENVELGGEHYRLVSSEPGSVNEQAHRLITGNRQKAYGHPYEDFSATAEFWSTWLRHKYGVDIALDPHDVAYMMSLLKHSREANKHTDDNRVDICGYMGTDELVSDYEKALEKRPPAPPGWTPSADA